MKTLDETSAFPVRSRMLTLPNLLTLLRVLVVPPLTFLLWQKTSAGYVFAFALYALAATTDYLDGYLARAQGTVSRLGIFLDPVADKVMVASVIAMLIANQEISGLNVVAAIAILLREIVVSGLREFLGGIQVSLPVSTLAKWKTAVQMVALGAILLGGATGADSVVGVVGTIGLWSAAILTVVTGWTYLRVGLRHMD